MVFQCRCGALAGKRSPRGLQPHFYRPEQLDQMRDVRQHETGRAQQWARLQAASCVAFARHRVRHRLRCPTPQAPFGALATRLMSLARYPASRYVLAARFKLIWVD